MSSLKLVHKHEASLVEDTPSFFRIAVFFGLGPKVINLEHELLVSFGWIDQIAILVSLTRHPDLRKQQRVTGANLL
jgi:hypothetical protein